MRDRVDDRALVVEERVALGDLAARWDELVDTMPLPSPFLRSWWLGAVAVGDPCFVVVLDRDELVGGAAFQRSRKAGCEWLELLGDGPLEPDHLDVVAAPHDVAAVIDALGRWFRRGDRGVIDLVGLVDQSWMVQALPRWTMVSEVEVAPFAALPSDPAAYLAGRPGQVRSTISRTAKRLSKAGFTPRVRRADEVDAALDDLHRLHDARWGAESGFLDAWPAFSAAVRAGAAAGEAIFTDLVDGDGRVVAIELELVCGGRASFYQAGRLDDRDLRGSGSVLKSAIIERLIGQGCTEFDLLRGDESYKADWSTSARPVMAARVGVGPRGMALLAASRAKHRAEVRFPALRPSRPGPDEVSLAR